MQVNETIIVALLGCVGTIIGSLIGILSANKLTIYRIEQLEKKVDKHNNVVEHVAMLERSQCTVLEKFDDLKARIERQCTK